MRSNAKGHFTAAAMTRDERVSSGGILGSQGAEAEENQWDESN